MIAKKLGESSALVTVLIWISPLTSEISMLFSRNEEISWQYMKFIAWYPVSQYHDSNLICRARSNLIILEYNKYFD